LDRPGHLCRHAGQPTAGWASCRQLQAAVGPADGQRPAGGPSSHPLWNFGMQVVRVSTPLLPASWCG
jgi:hypothetical protein